MKKTRSVRSRARLLPATLALALTSTALIASCATTKTGRPTIRPLRSPPRHRTWIAFANTVAHRVSAEVSRHISLGLGAYLAFAASIVLAVRGLPRS